MSYILDALKKADAEREQGRVPGLHTPMANLEADLPPLGGRPPAWVMGLGSVLVLAALGSAWWWTRPVATTPVTPTAPIPTQAPSPSLAAVPTPLSTPSVSPPPVTPSPASAQTAAPAPQTEVRSPAVTPPQTISPAPAATPAKRSTRAPIHVDPATTAATPTQVPSLAELPEDVRRSLPALTVSGAMYSDQPASRMLLINNRVFHEGDQPVAGLVLEEIRLKSAVFRYRGTRYAVSY